MNSCNRPFGSLQKQESRSVIFSLAFLPPDVGGNAYVFETPVRFSPENLAKLAPALETSKAYIGVWPDCDDELVIWGFTSAPTMSKPGPMPFLFVDTNIG